MELSKEAKEEIMKAAESSPVISAQVSGSVLTGLLLENWDGNSWPPSPECPYNEKTQDALCRAFTSGILMAQALRIEQLLNLPVTH